MLQLFSELYHISKCKIVLDKNTKKMCSNIYYMTAKGNCQKYKNADFSHNNTNKLQTHLFVMMEKVLMTHCWMI